MYYNFDILLCANCAEKIIAALLYTHNILLIFLISNFKLFYWFWNIFQEFIIYNTAVCPCYNLFNSCLLTASFQFHR